MRVVFDILGATERSGGMRLHATELVGAWLHRYPDDKVTILGGRWAKREFEPHGADVIVWPNESVYGRAVGQILSSWIVGTIRRADFVISLSPIVSPLLPRRRAVAFQHDWRHKKNPHEFPATQRLYRRLWELSARRALVNVCISEKAARETQQHAPGAAVVVVENGRDHARWWPEASRQSVPRTVVTFGHHNNKRPELVIDGFALARASMPEPTRLQVLGARGEYAAKLRERARSRGVEDDVDLPGFVSELDYQALISGAAAIVLASSDEGFGLPIAEAEYLGIPAVITDDSGMEEIFGGYPLVCSPSPESVSQAIGAALATPRRAVYGSGDATWAAAAEEVRGLLLRGDL